MGEVAAVLLAGGSGTRFSEDVSKVYVPLAGRPVVQYSLESVEASGHIDHVVVVIRDGDNHEWERVRATVRPSKVRAVVAGGDSRHGSEWAGLKAVSTHVATADRVMLHDAARPFLTLDLIGRLVDTATATGAGVIPSVALDGEMVGDTGQLVDVEPLVSVQTPQLFASADLITAFEAANSAGFQGVDTAETVQTYCQTPIRHVTGHRRNLKITTIEDLHAAEAMAGSWDRGVWTG